MLSAFGPLMSALGTVMNDAVTVMSAEAKVLSTLASMNIAAGLVISTIGPVMSAPNPSDFISFREADFFYIHHSPLKLMNAIYD